MVRSSATKYEESRQIAVSAFRCHWLGFHFNPFASDQACGISPLYHHLTQKYPPDGDWVTLYSSSRLDSTSGSSPGRTCAFNRVKGLIRYYYPIKSHILYFRYHCSQNPALVKQETMRFCIWWFISFFIHDHNVFISKSYSYIFHCFE